MIESTTSTTVADPCEYCGLTADEAGVPVALTAVRRAPADEGAWPCEYALCAYCARDFATGRTACAEPDEHGDLCDCADGGHLTADEREAAGARCAALVAGAAGAPVAHKAPEPAQCTWVARCTNASVGTVTNASVGVIPVCDACLAYARSEALWTADAATFVPWGAEHGPAVPWRLATVRQAAERRAARLAHKAPASAPADPRNARVRAAAERTARALSGRALVAERDDPRADPFAREIAADEIARRAARRAGGSFRRLADANGRRQVAAPARIVHVSRYRVSGRPADLRGYSLA